MHWAEDNLRAALRRRNPGEAFTRGVMARVIREQGRDAGREGGRAAAPEVRRERSAARAQQTKKPLPFSQWSPFRRALAGGFVLILFAAGGTGFVKHRQDEVRAVEARRAGELAGEQAVAALRITTEKLNHVIERAQIAPVQINDNQVRGENDEDN